MLELTVTRKKVATTNFDYSHHISSGSICPYIKGYSLHLHIRALMKIIWCGVTRLGDSGVNRLRDTSAFVNTASHLLLTRRGKTRMDGVGIVFEFYTAPL